MPLGPGTIVLTQEAQLASKHQINTILSSNRETFRFLAEELNSPFARDVIRYTTYSHPGFSMTDSAFRQAASAIVDALKFCKDQECRDLALKMARLTVGIPTSESCHELNLAIDMFEENMKDLNGKRRVK